MNVCVCMCKRACSYVVQLSGPTDYPFCLNGSVFDSDTNNQETNSED